VGCRFHRFSFVTATLLFSLTSSIQLVGTGLIGAASVSAQTTENRSKEALLLYQVGTQQYNQGQFREALQTFQKVLALAKVKGDRQRETAALNYIGLVYFNLGQYPQALNCYNQTLVIAKKIGDKAGEGATLNNIGALYTTLGQYDQALKFFYRALVIIKQVGDKAQQGKTLTGIGSVYNNMGDYRQALKFFKQALVIIKQAGDKAQQGKTLTGIGAVYKNLGKYHQSLQIFEQALVIIKEVGDKAQQGKTLTGIASIYYILGQYPQSLNFYKQARTIFKEVGNKTGEATALTGMGPIYYLLGKYADAEQTLFAAIKVMEFLRNGLLDSDKVSMFETQAVTYRLLQQTLIVQKKTNAALEISERGRARAIVELLASRISESTASKLTIKPLEIRQIQLVAKKQNATLVQYSIIYNDFPLDANQKWRPAAILIWAIAPTGEVRFRLVDLNPLWQQQKITIRQLIPNYSNIVMEPPKSEQKVSNASNSVVAIAQRSIADRCIEIALFLLVAASIISIAAWLWRFRYSNNTILAEVSRKCRWLIISLLMLLVAGSNKFLLLLPQNEPIADSDSDRGLGFVFKAQKFSQSDRLKQLHKLLIEPIADFLPKEPNAHVIFIPQSFLFLVPFPALQDANGKYLIEKHTILSAPSIQVLDLTQKRTTGIFYGGSNALIVGNPTMPSLATHSGEPEQKLPSLPGAEQEAIAIAHLLKTQAIIGDRATKRAILQKMPSSRIIHLATHGLLDELRGLNSAIALAPDPPSSPPYQGGRGKVNGFLTAEEILDTKIKLNAELVVLSACDTGRGKITGDGIVGLSRSLISAGVKSVVVSLWSVPDAPTAFLMTEFYRQMQQQPDKARSLRKAMLTTMKQHPNPKDWAAFTLIGQAD
jgi:CHAT domain-containing protein/tetratricopeptide (TPR) repeat protein